jgi:hypothetical protein
MLNEIPPEMTAAAGEASHALQAARRLAENDPALLPLLLLAVAIARAAQRVSESIDAIGYQPVDLDGIERGLSDVAGAITNSY